MTLSDAIFSIHGCFVTIDGWRADVSTKAALLSDGLCNVRAVDPADADKADELLYSPISDTGVMACNDPRLVELAGRHWTWLNRDAEDFTDTPAEIHADQVTAARAFHRWLTLYP